jgi:hypothetical protein
LVQVEAAQQQTIPMVLLEEAPLSPQSLLLAVVVAAVLTHPQVQVAVLAVVAVKRELLAAQVIRQAQVHRRVTMVEILVVLITT